MRFDKPALFRVIFYKKSPLALSTETYKTDIDVLTINQDASETFLSAIQQVCGVLSWAMHLNLNVRSSRKRCRRRRSVRAMPVTWWNWSTSWRKTCASVCSAVTDSRHQTVGMRTVLASLFDLILLRSAYVGRGAEELEGAPAPRTRSRPLLGRPRAAGGEVRCSERRGRCIAVDGICGHRRECARRSMEQRGALRAVEDEAAHSRDRYFP